MRSCALALALVMAATASAAATKPASAPAGVLWRAGGHLTAADGRSFDYLVDLFRYRTARGEAYYPADATLLDESSQQRYTERFVERASFVEERSDTHGYALNESDWKLVVPARRTGPLALRVRVPGATLDLHAIVEKPPVALDLGRGPSAFWPSLSCIAQIRLASGNVALKGKGWIERASAGEAIAPSRGVAESFVVQLDDGREILVGSDGPTARGAIPHAAIVRENGSVETLGARDYFFGGRNVWHSPHTPTDYPDQWGIYVPGQTEVLLFEPVMLDQESDGHGAGADFYEAAYDVDDVTPGSSGARLGSAFGLLTGFGSRGAMR